MDPKNNKTHSHMHTFFKSLFLYLRIHFIFRSFKHTVSTPWGFDSVAVWVKSNTMHLQGRCIAYIRLQCDQLSPCLWSYMPECLSCSSPDWAEYILAVVTRAKTPSLIIKRAPLWCSGAAVPMQKQMRSDDDDRMSVERRDPEWVTRGQDPRGWPQLGFAHHLLPETGHPSPSAAIHLDHLPDTHGLCYMCMHIQMQMPTVLIPSDNTV